MLDRGSTISLVSKEGIASGLAANEFFPVFQPVINRNGELSYFELLMRWNTCSKILGPNEFIEIAEESGLSRTMFDFAVDEALDFCAARNDGIPVSINLPPSDIVHASFFERAQRIAQRAQGRFDRVPVILEITEGLLSTTKCEKFLCEQIERVRDLGLRVAIDDFGVGYSSLSRVTSIQVDIIKLDRSFMHAKMSSRVLGKVIEFCHAVKAKVTVEGIETQEQLDIATQAGCDAVQGYLISRPMAKDVAQNWLPAKSALAA